MDNLENNIFKEFQEKKQNVLELVKKATESKWLDDKTQEEIINKINEDTLTIGVIGQMKCGKSTFLNSFLFGEQLLPAATTPMTAALSIITYGEQKGVEVEFYQKDEWEELITLAQQDERSMETAQSKLSIKAAKELYDKSATIKSEINNLLGTLKKDSLDNLIEYVGAEGKYVSIVKSVKITLPEDWLKGIEIVDTPGFNDPIVSREERTKDFLKRADVVILMLYAGRAFDSTDRDILFEKVRKVGVGKIVIAVNKYELQLLQNESPEEIKANVIDGLKSEMKAYQGESISDLLKDIDPILISSQLALLAKMPIDKIRQDKNLLEHYNNCCDQFETTSKEKLYKISQASQLEEKVKEIISTQKEEILIRKPINLIFQKANNILKDIEQNLFQLKEKEENLKIPDEELITKIENLEKVQRKINKKIHIAEQTLDDLYDDKTENIARSFEDIVDQTKSDCYKLTEVYKKDTLAHKIKERIRKFQDREIPRFCNDITKTLMKSFQEPISELSDDIDSIITRYLDDNDTETILSNFNYALKKGFKMEISPRTENLSEREGKTFRNNESTWSTILEGAGVIVAGAIERALLPISVPYHYFQTHREEWRRFVDSYFERVEPIINKVRETMVDNKDVFFENFNGNAVKELIDALVADAQEAINSEETREQKLKDVQTQIENLNNQKRELENQYAQLKAMV